MQESPINSMIIMHGMKLYTCKHTSSHNSSPGGQAGRDAGRQTKNLVFAIFLYTQASIIVALFYALYLGLVTSKQFDKGIFRGVICEVIIMLIGCFFWAAIFGVRVIFGAILTTELISIHDPKLI